MFCRRPSRDEAVHPPTEVGGFALLGVESWVLHACRNVVFQSNSFDVLLTPRLKGEGCLVEPRPRVRGVADAKTVLIARGVGSNTKLDELADGPACIMERWSMWILGPPEGAYKQTYLLVMAW